MDAPYATDATDYKIMPSVQADIPSGLSPIVDEAGDKIAPTRITTAEAHIAGLDEFMLVYAPGGTGGWYDYCTGPSANQYKNPSGLRHLGAHLENGRHLKGWNVSEAFSQPIPDPPRRSSSESESRSPLRAHGGLLAFPDRVSVAPQIVNSSCGLSTAGKVVIYESSRERGMFTESAAGPIGTCLYYDVIDGEIVGDRLSGKVLGGGERYAWANKTFFVGEGRNLPGLGVEYGVWWPA